MTKAILIDSAKQEIREVELSDDNTVRATEINRLLGGYIEVAYMWPTGDTLYVDEEGLLKQKDGWFRIVVRPDQPLAGNGIVLGREVEKEDEDYSNDPPTITVDDLFFMVQFLSSR